MADDPLPKILHLLDLLSVRSGTTQATVERLEVKVERLEVKVDALTTEVRSGVDRLDRKFGLFETRVEALEARP